MRRGYEELPQGAIGRQRPASSEQIKPTFAIIGSGCLALTLAACATANSPAQDLAYARWATCSVPYTQLEQVLLDGRIVFLSTNSADTQAVLQCLHEAGQAGPRLPDPVPVRPRGGV